MLTALIPILGQLALKAVDVFAQIHQASVASNGPVSNTTKVLAILPVALDVYNAVNQVGATLQQAQSENWADDDPRWQPAFDVADKALAAAEARLT